MHSPETRRVGLLFLFFFPLDPVGFFCFCFYHFHFLIFLKSLTLPVKIMAIADRHIKVSAFSQPLTLWFEKFLASLPHSLEKNIQSYVAESSYYKRKFT